MGRLGEVVVVVMGVRWPAEPMQQEVKGCGRRWRERWVSGEQIQDQQSLKPRLSVPPQETGSGAER